jgi:26S proteasome regulatory subunit N1
MCTDEEVKLQLCYMLARHGTLTISTEEEKYLSIIGNTQLSEHFLSLARDLDVFEAKTPEDIYKSHLTESRAGTAAVDSARANLASTFVNAFVNAGFGHDTLMTGPESKWIHKNKEHGMMSAAASLGLILLWDVDSGLSQIDKFTYSDNDFIRSGAALAVGIVSANVRSECDPALALLSEKLDADKSVIMRIGASLGLGLAYAGTKREDILELLTPIIADPGTPIELFSLAALALGFVFVGSGKADIAETIYTVYFLCSCVMNISK